MDPLNIFPIDFLIYCSKINVIEAIYQCLMNDVDRYREFELKPLERMKTANRKSGTVGDIDLWENGRPIEAVEIKYEVHVGVSHVSEAIQKVQTESVERYFILSTVKPDPNEYHSSHYTLSGDNQFSSPFLPLQYHCHINILAYEFQ